MADFAPFTYSSANFLPFSSSDLDSSADFALAASCSLASSAYSFRSSASFSSYSYHVLWAVSPLNQAPISRASPLSVSDIL